MTNKYNRDSMKCTRVLKFQSQLKIQAMYLKIIHTSNYSQLYNLLSPKLNSTLTNLIRVIKNVQHRYKSTKTLCYLNWELLLIKKFHFNLYCSWIACMQSTEEYELETFDFNHIFINLNKWMFLQIPNSNN